MTDKPAVSIVQSSPKALAAATDEAERNKSNPQAFYPFEELENGQSFTVPFLPPINWKSLRVMVSKKNGKYRNADGSQQRKFVFLKHDDLNVYEVARII